MATKKITKKVTTKPSVVQKTDMMEKVFGSVKNVKEAETLIKQTSVLFVALGVIMSALAIMVSPVAWVDAVILFALAGLLFKLRARWVAGVMIGYAGLTLVGTVISQAWSSVFLAIFVMWMAIRAWKAAKFLVSSR